MPPCWQVPKVPKVPNHSSLCMDPSEPAMRPYLRSAAKIPVCWHSSKHFNTLQHFLLGPCAIFQRWARMRRLATELQTHLRLSSTARLAKCHSGLADVSRQIWNWFDRMNPMFSRSSLMTSPYSDLLYEDCHFELCQKLISVLHDLWWNLRFSCDTQVDLQISIPHHCGAETHQTPAKLRRSWACRGPGIVWNNFKGGTAWLQFYRQWSRQWICWMPMACGRTQGDGLLVQQIAHGSCVLGW